MRKEFKIGDQVRSKTTGDAVLTIEELTETIAKCLEVVNKGSAFFGLGQTPIESNYKHHMILVSELEHVSEQNSAEDIP